MAKILPGGQKMAHQGAEWESTENPKVSRVTSGCGHDMIPLGQVRLIEKTVLLWV